MLNTNKNTIINNNSYNDNDNYDNDNDNDNDTNKLNINKHYKYIKIFNDNIMNNHNIYQEFWGIGIENETYLMTDKFVNVGKNFLLNNTKSERYSINYFLNYKMDEYKNKVSSIRYVNVPYYINSYMFQYMDIYGENKTLFTKNFKINNNFCGMTIHEYMKKISKKYNNLFDKNIIFDGDTFEFVTNNFYKATVNDTINELNKIKKTFLIEINKFLANKFIFSGYGNNIKFPSYNYGFVKYMTNKNNIGICNSGTYHINITLPTLISKNDMNIVNPIKFKNIHKNAIRLIQWIEPFIIALYGTPDILSCVGDCSDIGYCRGSLRLMMSRYIGLGTYDTDIMNPGKKLNDLNYKIDYSHYFNRLHKNSPYIPPKLIGYDFNYNKYKNHGIELRILDYFPEEYLTDVINFIILVCQHSYYINDYVLKPQDYTIWNDFVISCISKGSETTVSNELYLLLKKIFGIENNITCCNISSIFKSNKKRKIINVITKISDFLYNKYHNDNTIVTKMSPLMKKIVWIDYNKIIKNYYIHSIQLKKPI